MAGTLLPDMPMSDLAAIQGFDGVTSPKDFYGFFLLSQCFVYSNLHPAVLRESFCVLNAFENMDASR